MQPDKNKVPKRYQVKKKYVNKPLVGYMQLGAQR